MKAAFQADGVAVYQFNEAASGQSVFHLHFHIVPRFEGVAVKPHGSKMEDPAVLAANAEKIRAALGELISAQRSNRVRCHCDKALASPYSLSGFGSGIRDGLIHASAQ